MRTLLLKGLLFTMLIFAGLGVFVTLVAFATNQMMAGNNTPMFILFGCIIFGVTFMVCFMPSILVEYSLIEKRKYDNWTGGPL